MTHSQILVLGKFSAQSSHLLTFHFTFHKEQHNLRLRDLDHQDRQNFDAVTRLTNINVLSLLNEFPDAVGTILLACDKKIESYLRKDLFPLQRIEDAWFSLFFV